MPLSIYFLLPVLFIASWMDWRERRIPNSLIILSFILALGLNLVIWGPSGFLNSLAGATMGFILLFIPYILGGIGAGDVKLLMVIGSFGGISFVLYSFLIGAVIGGFLTLTFLVFGGRKEHNISIPYAIALSLGALIWIMFLHWGP